MARAFGMAGGIKVYDDDGNDLTERTRRGFPQGPDAFDRHIADTELELVRSVLAGPSRDEEPELRALGWRPGDDSGGRRSEGSRTRP